ncbi:MAG: IgGFc-binding protein, partial [Flavobacteriales bacterium]|nr:IgGFc-binding protein [Flavobacteriales bacterium]
MKKALLLVLGLLLTELVQAQTGTEFWMAPPDVTLRHNMPGDEPIFINVAAGNAPATVTISQPANAGFNGGVPIVLNLAANTSTRYNLTALKAQLETRPTNAVLNTGLRIQSTANITCYYEPSNTNNPDIMALKGANGLGTEFYIPLHKHAPFYNHNFSPNDADLAFASFDIVATENNTLVMIYSPVAVDGHPALVPFTITLQQGQTYSCANTAPATHFDPLTHPSGAVVLSDKPIAISIKDDSNHNPSGGCYDLMLDQIVPVDILGTDYIAVKGALNATGDESLFLMAVENNTQVFIDGNATPVATLFAGQYYRHDMDYLSGAANNSTFVSGSKPLYAIHVTGFGCEQGMAILPPLNCAGSTNLSFTRSTSEAFFLNLLVRNGSQDDFVVSPASATIPASAFQAVPGTGGLWMAARIQYNTTEVPVNQAFSVTNTTDVFSLAIINGGGSSGCRYGFFSEFSGRIDVNAGPDVTLCADQQVPLAGTVTGGSTTGIWTTNGSGTFTPNANTLNATYEPSLGDIALGTVTLTLTSTGNCTPVSDTRVITFAPRPLPEAGADQLICSNNPQVTLNGSILNALGGVWSGGVGSFLPATNNLNAAY